jgi:hypothetical protein
MSQPSQFDKSLLPCPFCGSEPRFLPFKAGFYEEKVICDYCGFSIEGGYEKSAEKWNTRATLSAVVPTGWIRVKDRLPNNHQHCLVWLDGASVACIATLNRRHENSLGSDLIYYFVLGQGAGERQLEEVTHWMPLPSAPNAERDNIHSIDGGPMPVLPDSPGVEAPAYTPSHVAPSGPPLARTSESGTRDLLHHARTIVDNGPFHRGSEQYAILNSALNQLEARMSSASSSIGEREPEWRADEEYVVASRYQLQRIYHALLDGKFYEDYDAATKMTGWLRGMLNSPATPSASGDSHG